jgi:hypothetical protein
MSEDRPGDGTQAPSGSVFGNLPRERPGTRSPRREGSAGARARPEPARAQEPTAEDAAGGAGGASEIHGIDDLAWAGVAIAAEAATLGVRLASRAIEAIRGPTEP